MHRQAEVSENTRLFILAGKGIKEDLYREKFEQFGKIEDIWIVKDKRTNEDKGVIYITFSKVSEAALAMEEMNGKCMEGNPRPLKVLMANTKRDGSVRDPREDEKLVRLFVIIPKTMDEKELTEEFSQFGDVASVNVLREKDTGAPKGFAYVRFHRPYHAALALEGCKSSFKPKFAEPKRISMEPDRYSRDSRDRDSRDSYSDRRGGGGYDDRDRDRDRMDRDRDRGRGSGAPGGYPYGDRVDDRDRRRSLDRDNLDRDRGRSSGSSDNHLYGDRGLKRGFDDFVDRDIRRDRREDYIADDGRSRYSEDASFSRGLVDTTSPMALIQEFQHNNMQRLVVTAPLGLTQSYLHRLFNLIPGLEYCDLNEQTGMAYVRYQTPQCAAWARDKLDGFEYPIGSRLLVRYADLANQTQDRGGFDTMSSYRSTSSGMDLMNDSSAVHQAAKVLEQAGINPDLVLQQPQQLMPSAAHSHMSTISQMSQLASTPEKLERVTYCNLKLPLPKPLVPEDTPTAQRLFIVCQPAAVPERILRDAFSRFGNLIEVYLLSGRNFGYAKYATEQSAAAAIETLHGQCVAGQRLKVLEAEAPKNPAEEDSHKRQRVESMH